MANWQAWIAIFLCLTAAAYVARRVWLAIAAHKAEGCGSGCGTCPANSAPSAKQLLSIEPNVGPRPDAH